MPSSESNIKDLIQRGLALHESGRIAEAETIYRQVLSTAPDNFNALHLLGVATFQKGDPRQSIELITKALTIDQTQAAAHTNLGNAYHALGDLNAAIACYDRALSIAPHHLAAHLNRGNALQDAGRFIESLACYDRAIEIEPTNADAHNNRGNLLIDLARAPQALESFSKALTLRPDFTDALINKGSTLRTLGNLDAAIECLDRAIALSPSNPFAFNNRGNVLRDLGRYSEAIESYQAALKIAPDFADAHLNMSYAYLICGDLPRGFEHYEWRRIAPSLSSFMRHCNQPPWTGRESLAGKTVLVHCEQGFGDTIQFSRYITVLRSHGARIIFEVQRSLKLLMEGLEGPSVVIAEGEPAPHFDYYVPLLSLPCLFGTTIDTIPSPGRYLHTPREKTAMWLGRFGTRGVTRIGLTWSGSTTLSNDRFRSIPLAELLLALPKGPTYVCLQKEIRETDRAALSSRLDIVLVEEELYDFADTAALIDSLDLVISVDTAVAHLAGALNRPVLIMLPCNSEWRWLRGRSDSPWYPSATLSRQTTLGAWEPVLEDVHQRVCALANKGLG